MSVAGRFSSILFMGFAAIALAACTTNGAYLGTSTVQTGFLVPATDEPYEVAPVNLSLIDRKYHRQVVNYKADQKPGSIVVDPQNKFLYFIMDGNKAMRYGIGVGRQGFGWSGNATIKRKRSWPTWTPPKEMQIRQPETAEWANGMPGGPQNPLGARALYLYQGNKDTLYRIHGTPEWRSIGQNVSSGCIRMLNADIIDLHQRTPIGSEVTVLEARNPLSDVRDQIIEIVS
ncbi:MAG: L,D-transpeptidase [Pseudomonadota bacterium]